MNWSNYDHVLDQLRAAGLQPELPLELVGPAPAKPPRCYVDDDRTREKRGWYALHEWLRSDGEVLLVGRYGIWSGAGTTSDKIDLPKAVPGKPKMTPAERDAIKQRLAEDDKRARAHRAAVADRAAARATHVWGMCVADGDSAYLRRKGVGGHGVRYSPSGALVIPMLDAGGRIHGLQVVRPKSAVAPGGAKLPEKQYWPKGMVKAGKFFLLGPMPTSVVLVAEGYATAASLFEATGLPVAVAFDAGNLKPVAEALRARYKGLRFLVCADDDYLTDGNPGVSAAATAALAVSGAWVKPEFAADRAGKKITDYNDLHAAEGLHAVRVQLEAKVRQLGWNDPVAQAQPGRATGGGGAAPGAQTELLPIESTEELQERYALVYELPETVFDAQEHKLVPLASLRNACVGRHVHRDWMESRSKRLVRVSEVGFDPAGEDPAVKCNLWGGWPTQPKSGDCDTLLELLYYLCSFEKTADEIYRWVLCWLAYPIQHPGAKMRTALVLHGPQGTGKNMFFEAIMAIYGEYGRIVDQSAVEDKFNDWASRKLFLIADEVVARMELFHVKNKLKSLITGEWVRINPKNIGAYDEKNHVNLVFLSNETQPLALERDDRRYTVIWTPPKMPPNFYEAVRVELQGGGVAALHQYLLNYDLGDFKPWTAPPMTGAKADLIELGMDSTERFWQDWSQRAVPLPLCAARSEDLYDAYRQWCSRQGVAKPAQMSTFLGNCSKRPGASKARKRHYVDGSDVADAQSMCVFPDESETAVDKRTLSDSLDNFAASVKKWRASRQFTPEMA